MSGLGSGLEDSGESGGEEGFMGPPAGSQVYPTHELSPCAGCVRIVTLQGEPTAALAPELTFDFAIETVGE